MKHLIDVGPRLAECNRCKAYVLAGMQSGCRYAVDPGPLNPATYRALTLIGGMTWRLKGQFFGDHGCGCSALDASAFEELVEDPCSAPAPGSPEAVLAGQGMTCSVVESARPRRSDVARCDQCGELIKHDEPRIMVEMPVWQQNTHKVPNRGSRRGYTREYEGYGYTRWTRHPDGCPALMTG